MRLAPDHHHWPEYLVEATCLGLFVISAVAFATLLQHPSSPLVAWHSSPFVRRIPMGVAMGLTAMALIYSPLGRRSGAHMNPAVTLAFARLGKVAPRDAFGYVGAQFAGGTIGIVAATLLLGGLPSHPSVNYIATLPGAHGSAAAFAAEAAISFLMMAMVLCLSNTPQLARFTGASAGLLVATYIVFEAPVSGMSMNPARTFGPNLFAGAAHTLWVYFTAPPIGTLVAAEVFVRWRGRSWIRCAKLHHTPGAACIFRCAYGASPPPRATQGRMAPVLQRTELVR